ncbi:hypothetical protein M5K25_002475 [Dendrobium thyrsiflorum]|uniref:Uncharacterized protein n=1 Tax=Dendrobium thyrsiflorum TaxID=117978 RepID=A0ABD0VME7_DENTH
MAQDLIYMVMIQACLAKLLNNNVHFSILFTFGRSFLHWDIAQVEVLSVLAVGDHVLDWMQDVEGIIIESHNYNVIKFFSSIHNKELDSDGILNLKDLEFLDNFNQICFDFSFRECNRLADYCANLALLSDFFWDDISDNKVPPSFVRRCTIVQDDLDGSELENQFLDDSSRTTAKQQAGPALNKANNDPSMASRSIPSKQLSLRTPQSGFKLVSASFSSASRPASISSDLASSCLGIMRNSTRNTVRSSSSFSSKTLSKTTRCRTGSTNPICNSGLVESTLLLSKFSPTSSIDSFPSESSSQTFTSTNQSNLIQAMCGLSSSPGIPVSTENGASQKSGTTSLGLRMPRPRIGYFDKEKTLLHGSNNLLTSLRSSLTKSNGNSETSAANKSKLINSPSVRSGAHPYSLNQTSKSTGGQMVLQTLDKYQVVTAKLRKESSPRIAEGNCKRNLQNKIDHPNLLQLKYVMENEIHESGEQKINDQSFLTNIQLEHLQRELISVTGTGKENLCPESKTECKSKASRNEEQYNTVPMGAEMVSSLSLSENQRSIQ